MIVAARESRGWLQKDLATAIRTNQSTISRYELGVIPVPEYHVDAISAALNYEREFFEQPELLVGLGGDFLYRKRASVTAKAQRRVEAEANIRRIQISRLLRAASVPERFPFPVIPEECAGHPEMAAKETRRAFRLPTGPVRNLTRVVENAGAIVFTVDFGTNLIDGTNIRMPGLPPLLFLNHNVPGERHRFNIAHELGHAVMHFSMALGDAEDEANAFAQEFLMPRTEIRSDLRNLDLSAAMRLKRVWGVSMSALIRRAKDLKVISQDRYRRLNTQMGASNIRLQEPEPLPMEKPETFEGLLSLHRTKLAFSDEEMRRLLFTDRLGEIPVPRVPQMRIAGLFDESQG